MENTKPMIVFIDEMSGLTEEQIVVLGARLEEKGFVVGKQIDLLKNSTEGITENDGLFEVLSHDGRSMTIRAVDRMASVTHIVSDEVEPGRKQFCKPAFKNGKGKRKKDWMR